MQELYNSKEVMWYIDNAYRIEHNYFRFSADNHVRIGWLDIKYAVGTLDEPYQKLFRSFYEGHTVEELAWERNIKPMDIYHLKYKITKLIMKVLNNPRSPHHPTHP